jgi:transcription initiation factor TFIID subunit TAF12
LPAVVVLPAPCKPARRITAGGCVANDSGTAVPPISDVKLAMHDADQRLAGRQRADDFLAERLLLTDATNVANDRKRTSASSSASRTSRSASWMFSSVRRLRRAVP